MRRTRLSLFYLSSYLLLIGLGLPFAPHATLTILQSNGDYGDIFPRIAGMLMSGISFALFLVLLGVVGLGFALTLTAYFLDRGSPVADSGAQ